MVYITLDTCVWLELLKVEIHTEDNLFDEILFWIEQRFITCITTPNLLREWDRNKVSKKEGILHDLKEADKHFGNPLKANPLMNSLYQPDNIEDILNKRIERLDRIFRTIAVEAEGEENIFPEAIKRNLACIAPNHTQDSFRDTVNILTLINFIQQKGFNPCYFSTINYRDFSAAKSEKHKLHHQLQEEFSSAKLEYIYFENEPPNYAGRLLHALRTHNLPPLSEHLKEKIKKEEEKKLSEKKEEERELMKITDPEFLENLPYIDTILNRKNPSKFDEEILDKLFNKHPGYREYFMKNLGKNGLA